MQKFILKNNKRFQILNVLTDLVDVFRPKIFEPVKLRVLTRKKNPVHPQKAIAKTTCTSRNTRICFAILVPSFFIHLLEIGSVKFVQKLTMYYGFIDFTTKSGFYKKIAK